MTSEAKGTPADTRERVYTNAGNPAVVALVDSDVDTVLDVGCGAGDNARVLKLRFPHCHLFGITHSEREKEIAQSTLEQCWVFDIERDIPLDLWGRKFDVLIFSHVLEHLKEPAAVLSRFSRLIKPGGTAVIAVPNTLTLRQRLEFLRGRFEYEAAGILDDTHLRFFTYTSASRYLLAQSADLTLEHQSATGSVPLWWLRRYLLPKSWSTAIDRWGCRHWPNLFGGQILIRARKR